MSELTALKNTLTLPGCTLHRCGLQIEGEIDKPQLENIGRSLNAIGGSAMWWWGDYLFHVGKKYGETYAASVEESSYAPGTLANAKFVCSRIQFSSRSEDLTFSHHYEALSECGGDHVDEALYWLTRARAEKWSVPQMRKEIRLAKSTHDSDNDHEGQSSPFAFVLSLKAWLHTGLADASPEQRAELKADLLAIAEKL